MTPLESFLRTGHRALTQTNKWSCGPSALRHAMLCHGIRVAWRTAAALAQIDARFDFDKNDTTPGLREAATQCGFAMGCVIFYQESIVKFALKNYAHAGVPVMICIDDWSHWVVVVHADARHVRILDSSRPGPVLQRLTWRTFLHRACRWHPGETRFDLYPVRDVRLRKSGRLLSESEAP